MFAPSTPEAVAFAYVERNIGPNYKVSKVSIESGNVRVTFDGIFRGRCPTCRHAVEEIVEDVFSVIVRREDLKVIGKPNLKNLKKRIIAAGLGFLLEM